MIRTFALHLRLAAALLLAAWLPAGAERGEGAPGSDRASLGVACSEADLDPQYCSAWGAGEDKGACPREVLLGLLGLGAGQADSPPWSTGPVAGEVRRFRIAFKRPVEPGTLICEYAGDHARVEYLKEDAPYPGGMDEDAHWQALPDGAVRALPAGARVRALRFTDLNYALPWAPNARPSQIARVLLLKGRFHNPVRLGGDQWSGDGGRWLGYWTRPVPVAGLAVLGRIPPEIGVAYLPAQVAAHPLLADAESWQAVKIDAAASGPGRLVFERTVDCRGLRVVGAGLGPDPRTRPHLLPLAPLADGEEPPSLLPEPPFAFQYQMPLDGFMAARISDDKGREVRRLIAEVARSAGAVREPWDLKDDDGRFVEPGGYHWRGIARPPLKLTYEMTVYNAGRPPWRAPVPGGGWWMADHCPPMSVCAVGDRLFFGAAGAEFGVGLIATDLDGRKVWDEPQGTPRLTGDGRFAYVVHDDSVVRIDPQNGFAQQTILRFHYSDDLPGHAPAYIAADRSSVAARPGLLCVGYDASGTPWIRSSFHAEDIDFGRTFPPPPAIRVHDTELNPKERVLSAFLTMRSSQQGGFGDALTTGPMARTLVLALSKEAPIGSVLVPNGAVRVHALKPGKELPASLRAGSADEAGADLSGEPAVGPGLPGFADMDAQFPEDTWTSLATPGAGRPGVAVAAHGERTKALVFTAPDLSRLDYVLVLDRRYRDATADARLLMLEGERKGPGGWETRRGDENPISPGNPATAGFVWAKPVPLRGLALLRPMAWAGVDVDVWTGDPEAAVGEAEMGLEESWRRVCRYRKSDNGLKFGWHTDVVLTADFGAVIPVRALRVRIVEPPRRPLGEARRAVAGGFEALVAFQPLGQDVDLPEGLPQRVTVIRLPKEAGGQAAVLRHFPLPHVRGLAFGRDGSLYAACRLGIVRMPDPESEAGAPQMTVVVPPEAMGAPRAMAADAEGLLYVIDAAAKNVRVFDPRTGRQVRELGTPGGLATGPYDPTRFTEPVALDSDRNGKVWVVEQHFQPKRITRWSADGKLEKQFMGPTHYGGGGMMDPGDRTVVNHLGMKFRINYADKTWRLESRLRPYMWPTYQPDRVVYLAGRRYLVGDRPVVMPFGDSGPTSVICEERDGLAVDLVAAGVLGDWHRCQESKELQKAWAGLDPARTAFCWSDLNRDGAAQREEVQVIPGGRIMRSPMVGDDLSLNFPNGGVGHRLRPVQVRADGLPVYDVRLLEEVPELDNSVMVTAEGETFVMGHKFLAADGKVLWRYPDAFMGVQNSSKTPWGFYSRPPGVLCGGMQAIGHFEIAGEHLFCVGGNNGDYYAFTRDGLLAAAILGGPRGYGKRFFSMPEAVPGRTDLSDLRKTVEDFEGHVTRADDGRVYAIAGKNHITVIRVDGLEGMKRVEGTFEVKAEDLRRTAAWAVEHSSLRQLAQPPRVSAVPSMRKRPTIDGRTAIDWLNVPVLTIRRETDDKGRVIALSEARLAFDRQNLYIAAQSLDDSPMANGARDAKAVFQHGDALDVQLGLNPQADPARRDAGAGDVRLLICRLNGAPVAVAFRYQLDKGEPGGEEAVFASPMGETRVADVRVLKDARVCMLAESLSGERGWSVEAAIPWRSLGVQAPKESVALRGDVGVLESDPNGVTTVARYYWANKSYIPLSDQPLEARVHPPLWGELRFRAPDLGEALKLGVDGDENEEELIP